MKQGSAMKAKNKWRRELIVMDSFFWCEEMPQYLIMVLIHISTEIYRKNSEERSKFYFNKNFGV